MIPLPVGLEFQFLLVDLVFIRQRTVLITHQDTHPTHIPRLNRCEKICDKYPEWLATHRETLATADYQRYGKQYQSFQRVLAVYEVRFCRKEKAARERGGLLIRRSGLIKRGFDMIDEMTYGWSHYHSLCG